MKRNPEQDLNITTSKFIKLSGMKKKSGKFFKMSQTDNILET